MMLDPARRLFDVAQTLDESLEELALGSFEICGDALEYGSPDEHRLGVDRRREIGSSGEPI